MVRGIYLIPMIEDLIDQLIDEKYFSVLNLINALIQNRNRILWTVNHLEQTLRWVD